MDDPLFVDNAQPMWIYDRKTLAFLAVNKAAVGFYGYSPDEFLRMRLDHIGPAEDVPGLESELAEEGCDYKVSAGSRHRRKNGSLVDVEVHSTRYNYPGHDAVLASIHDVSEHHRLAEELNRQKEYFRQLFERSPEAVAFLDAEDRVLMPNSAFCTLFGYSAEEVKGRSINTLIVPDYLREEAEAMSRRALSNQLVDKETVRQTRDGHLLDVHLLGYPIIVEGRGVGIYTIYRDISERRKLTRKIAYQATHDPLTGLINRAEFERHLKRAVDKAQTEGAVHAVMLLGLDQFTVVNNVGGHTVGDDMLRRCAQEIKARVRGSDTVARFGGDQFGFLLEECSLDDAQRLAREFRDLVHDLRLQAGENIFQVTASIGLTVISEATEGFAGVLTEVETAFLTAKKRGGNRLQLYSEEDEMLARHQGELRWVTRIQRALEEGRFQLYYQRMESLLHDRDIAYYEILVRMIDEDGGLVAPGEFIPAAERYNLMPRIDRWVISNALARLRERLDKAADRREVASINVSATSLNDEAFADEVVQLFQAQALPPGCICFEITETAAMSNLAQAHKFIDRMHALGLKIALDDFGTGMSSFGYLRSMKVDYLKIDGSFVRTMVDNPVDFAMIEAINRVAQVIGVRTIAEFVESSAISDKLRTLGVDFVQGYAVHKPEPWGA